MTARILIVPDNPRLHPLGLFFGRCQLMSFLRTRQLKISRINTILRFLMSLAAIALL